MIEIENQLDFKKISYDKETETLNIEDNHENKMTFIRLPYFLFELFRESKYANEFLQNNIIGNPKLKWTVTETSDKISYSRGKKDNEKRK